MLRIKNLINSPYGITNADCEIVMIPAGGELEIDVHPMQLPILYSLGYFQITEAGKNSGSQPAGDGDDIERLRDEYTELTGKKPHHLWKAERLQEEIDKALVA